MQCAAYDFEIYVKFYNVNKYSSETLYNVLHIILIFHAFTRLQQIKCMAHVLHKIARHHTSYDWHCMTYTHIHDSHAILFTFFSFHLTMRLQFNVCTNFGLCLSRRFFDIDTIVVSLNTCANTLYF